MESEALNTAKLSFREQKAAELAAERSEDKPEKQPLDMEPEEGSTLEAVEDVAIDSNDSDAQEDTSTDDEELYEEPTSDDGADDDDTDGIDYKAQYEELQREYSRVTENRKQRDQEYADSIAQVVAMKHGVSESLEKARQGAEFYAHLANQQAQQYQQINWSQVPPEQVQQLQIQAQQAVANAQQQQQNLQQFREYEAGERERLRRQEAEMSVSRLKAIIPEWSNEHYTELGSLAGEYGYSREEFAEMTDHRLIEALHDIWKSRQAVKTVEKTVKQRSAKPPASRSGKTQTRNARGQYTKAKDNFANSPNQRGAFAAMKLAEMQAKKR